jgi:flagellin
MGLRINSNILSLNARGNLANVSERLSGNFSRLSSGLRIATAADDAAGLGISERLRAQVRSLNQAGRNAQDGISLVQTAEGSLQQTNENLSRLRELAVQASNGTLNTGDRVIIAAEFQSLSDEIGRVSADTTFNGVDLLNSSTFIDIQVGIEANQTISIELNPVSQTALGITNAGASVTSVSGAVAALNVIDSAIDSVAALRGKLGASQNRLGSAIRSIASTSENLSAAETRIRDVDVAFETADLTRNSILQQAAISVLSQANVQPQLALSLLGG